MSKPYMSPHITPFGYFQRFFLLQPFLVRNHDMGPHCWRNQTWCDQMPWAVLRKFPLNAVGLWPGVLWWTPFCFCLWSRFLRIPGTWSNLDFRQNISQMFATCFSLSKGSSNIPWTSSLIFYWNFLVVGWYSKCKPCNENPRNGCRKKIANWQLRPSLRLAPDEVLGNPTLPCPVFPKIVGFPPIHPLLNHPFWTNYN